MAPCWGGGVGDLQHGSGPRMIVGQWHCSDTSFPAPPSTGLEGAPGSVTGCGFEVDALSSAPDADWFGGQVVRAAAELD